MSKARLPSNRLSGRNRFRYEDSSGHHLRHPLARSGAAAASLGTVLAVLGIVLLTLGGAGAAGFGAEATHLAVERAFVRHQGHAGLAGRGAVKAGFGTIRHFRHSDTLGAAILALLEALQASLDAGLRFGHRYCVASFSPRRYAREKQANLLLLKVE